MPEARDFEPGDLRAGLSARFEREISEADIRDFSALSGDFNPLHTDRQYAASTNFQGCLVHGAFQVGLASAMAGMYLPGRKCLLGSIQARFPAPLYYPCRVRVSGELTSWNPSLESGVLRVTVQELSSATPSAEITVGVTLHSSRPLAAAEVLPQPETRAAAAGKPLVLITGASGGLGSRIASELCGSYTVLAAAGRHPDLLISGVERCQADLTEAGWAEQFETALRGRTLYGIVHAAWPGAPRGSLLDAGDEVILQQLSFGALQTIQLARFLFAHSAGEGRVVLLGSTYGTVKPAFHLGAYSLGKAALEQAVRLLAPELARRRITINAILPSFVPAGLNRNVLERTVLQETARVPLGRLCLPEDVAAAVRYLLSPDASFLSGQLLALTGGQL
ncbi:MAG: SDR family oxidoreductase [Bryobacteraceae bacterium]|jgi:3-oxoacyl-[acyl-carrier protein] reductase